MKENMKTLLWQNISRAPGTNRFIVVFLYSLLDWYIQYYTYFILSKIVSHWYHSHPWLCKISTYTIKCENFNSYKKHIIISVNGISGSGINGHGRRNDEICRESERPSKKGKEKEKEDKASQTCHWFTPTHFSPSFFHVQSFPHHNEHGALRPEQPLLLSLSSF